MLYHVILKFVEILKAWKFGMGFFAGLIFGPGFLGVLLEALGSFFRFRFLPAFNHPCH